MAPRSFSSAVAAIALLALLSSPVAWASEDVPLSADDECAPSADGEEPTCALNALQLKAKQREEQRREEEQQQLEQQGQQQEEQHDGQEVALEDGVNSTQQGCIGLPGCGVIMRFNKLFDTSNPAEMQKGMNEFTEWRTSTEGLKVAVTKDHYYEMYHGNVASKLGQYMPQGMFAWKFNNDYDLVRKTADTAVISRAGVITFNLGWWRRSMFWNAAVKGLPSGKSFDYSHVTEFNDCKDCPAKMEYTVKRGGLSGKEHGWKITDLVLLKLK